MTSSNVSGFPLTWANELVDNAARKSGVAIEDKGRFARYIGSYMFEFVRVVTSAVNASNEEERRKETETKQKKAKASQSLGARKRPFRVAFSNVKDALESLGFEDYIGETVASGDTVGKSYGNSRRMKPSESSKITAARQKKKKLAVKLNKASPEELADLEEEQNALFMKAVSKFG